MSQNPFINALVAAGYISLIAMFFSYMSQTPAFNDEALEMMAPVVFLSLLVFSVAIMGYLFVYQPVRLLIENKQKEATKFFLTTVFSFACITVAVVLSWFILSTLLF